MKRYRVPVEVWSYHGVYVYAETEDEAISKVEEMIENGDVEFDDYGDSGENVADGGIVEEIDDDGCIIGFTLDEIFDRAIGSTFLSPELKAKDEAMSQTEARMRRVFLMHDDTPLDEDDLLDYAKEVGLRYDNGGNIIY